VRVLVLGGTRFIGRAVVDALIAAGHEPLVCHRGEREPADLPAVPHLHADRSALATVRSSIDRFGAEAVIDCFAMTGPDTRAVLDALPPDPRLVVLSSGDVYRAFAAAQHGELTDAVPIDETSPLRSDRYPYPDREPEYSKLDVEEVARARGACVLRLPMTYGPFDEQRREEPMLRRVRAGRSRIPVGPGNALLPRGHVADVARGIVRAAEVSAAAGHVLNLCEERTWPVRLWDRMVLAAAGSDAELVEVGAGVELPPDLGLTRFVAQPLVESSARARALLGYHDTPVEAAIADSVAWHLAHPPDEVDADTDFIADDRALAAAR
jgi:nucleoside-diphosphate-sugar epimerase